MNFKQWFSNKRSSNSLLIWMFGLMTILSIFGMVWMMAVIFFTLKVGVKMNKFAWVIGDVIIFVVMYGCVLLFTEVKHSINYLLLAGSFYGAGCFTVWFFKMLFQKLLCKRRTTLWYYHIVEIALLAKRGAFRVARN